MVRASRRSHSCSRPERDTQQSRVYRAEEACGWGRRFDHLRAAQLYVSRVTATSYWERIPGSPQIVTVRDGRGRRSACAERTWYGAEIRLPRWARCELLVLHELAHTLVPEGRAAHGPEFAAHYLHLVRRFFSEDAWRELTEAFREHRVRHTTAGRHADSRKILRWVKELRALSASTDSPAEAASAASKAQKLLLKHNLSLEDLEAHPDDNDPLVEAKRAFSGRSRRIAYWRQFLLQAVARGSLCEWMTSFAQGGTPRTFSFIGRQSNVEVAGFLFQSLERQILELWEREKARLRSEGKSIRARRASFLEGVVEGIEERMRRDRARFERHTDGGRALVRDRHREAQAYRRELYPWVRFTTVYAGHDATTYARGKQAAGDVKIQTALGEGGKSQRLLE